MSLGRHSVKGNIIDVDEEWIKIAVTNKKGEHETKLVRIDRVSEVEIGKE